MDPFSVLTGSNFMSSVSFSFFLVGALHIVMVGKGAHGVWGLHCSRFIAVILHSCVNNDES